MNFDVICIGSAILDIFVKSEQFKTIPSGQFPSGIALCEAYGAKIETDEIHMASGGGATNSAVSFSRKGLKTACVAEIGKDLAATTILHELSQEQVDTSMIVQESTETTGVSVILISEQGARSIVTYRGAAAMLEIKDINWEKLSAKWFYITSLGGQTELLTKLVKHAHEKGIKVALNPGKKELEKINEIKNVYSSVDILILNLEEAVDYLEIESSSDSNHNTETICKRLQNEGGIITLVTNGEKGSFVVTKEKILSMSPPNVKVVKSATGAGDAFGSGFVAGQILHFDIEKSVKLANDNAGSVISYFGAKKGLVTLENFN